MHGRERTLPKQKGEPSPAPGRAVLSPARRLEPLFPVVILAAGLWAYHNSFAGAFLFDDERAIVDNPQLRHLWPFAGMTGLPPRPLVTMTLAVNYALGGVRSGGYHAVNLAIHVLAALTLYGVVRRTLSREPLRLRYPEMAPGLALSAALLWLVHPLQTESVTYIIQRAESLMGLLYLLTLYAVLRGAEAARWTPLWYAGAVICCGLGMASKEVMCTAPLLVLLYDRIFLAPSWGQLLRRRWGLYVGLAATWAILASPVSHALDRGPDPPPQAAASTTPGGEETTPPLPPPVRDDGVSAGFGMRSLTPLDYARSQPGVILHYLRLALWPDVLCLDYGWPVARDAGAVVLPSVLVGVLLLLTAWALVRRPRLGYLGAWFFLILAPTASVMPLADLAVEHRMYLPLAAAVVLVVLGGWELLGFLARRPSLSGGTPGWLGTGTVLVLVLLLGWRTISRNEDYRDPVTMWTAVVAQRPQNARAHDNLGRFLQEQGKLAEAERHCRTAVDLKPAAAVAHNTLGLCLTRQGKVVEAEQQYRLALRLQPGLAAARNNLGVLLAQQGQLPEAGEQFQLALQSNPGYADASFNLGLCLLQQGKLKEGVGRLQVALQLQPEHAGAHYNLGRVLAREGRCSEALPHFRAAVRLQPRHAAAHYGLAVCLLAEGKEDEALAHFQAAARLDPTIRGPAPGSLPEEGLGQLRPRR